MEEKVVIIDFGSQYSQLIGKLFRKAQIYSIILPRTISLREVLEQSPSAVILSGGPDDVSRKNFKRLDPKILECGVPVLGICYGAQLISLMLGGEVETLKNKEFGQFEISLMESEIFSNIEKENVCLMNHENIVTKLPEGFNVIASTKHSKIAAFCHPEKKIYGVQFHPEVTHTPFGLKLIENFLKIVCKCKCNWNMENFLEGNIKKIKEKVKQEKVLCAISGGVDSTVCAAIMKKAIGTNLKCIFVDHGMMRKKEKNEVLKMFKENFQIDILSIDAKERFLKRLELIKNPEEKRKIIGEEFVRVFEEEAKKLGLFDFLAQGTIYPDVIESGFNDSATIKSHHNVGGIPKNINFKDIIEPLRDLFKDEVRELGQKLGVPDKLIMRQPFPGPGFAVRIIGEITNEKLNMIKNAQEIFEEELENLNFNKKLSQYFAVLIDARSVGVTGDFRTYGYTIALRAVESIDYMTASFSKIPYEILEKVSKRITNEIENVNRVVYDITSKPPATIEWE